MTINTLFPQDNNLIEGQSSEKPIQSLRLKKIRPVYETIKVCDAVTKYLGDSTLSCSEHVSLMFDFLRQESKEHFWAVHLDNKNKILCLDQVSVGSLSASIVHPREVFKSALLSSATSILLVHNHPSSDTTPSPEDIEITTRLQAAGELLGINVLDHVVLGNGYYSLKAQGLM